MRITVVSSKGGVGKTTALIGLAAGLAERGQRCLLLDLDPTAGASAWIAQPGPQMAEAIIKGKPLAELAMPSRINGVEIVPADLSLAAVPRALAAEPGAECILRERLQAIDQPYDAVLIDTGPGLNLLAVMAMVAADGVLLPLVPDPLSVRGANQALDTIDQIKRRLNPSLRLLGVVPVRGKKGTRLFAEILDRMRHVYGAGFMQSHLRETVRQAEAPGWGKSVLEHAPESAAAADVRQFVDEVMTRISA